MYKKFYGSALLLLVAGLSSCSDENPWLGEAGYGAINLSLVTDSGVQEAAPETRGANHQFFNDPSADDFSIELEKSDGSYSRKFATVGKFLEEKSFPAGSYVIRALYGNLEDNEGFEMPHFSGSSQFTIREGQTTDVTLQASVAHAVITVEYEEAFKKHFTAYSATVHSEGHGYVTFDSTEERAGFVAPGKVTLAVSFTNQKGQSVTIEPAAFEAKAAHHYNIKLNVDGDSKDASLSISFDDGLTLEDINIDLTDELYTAPAPKINAVGFDVAEDTASPTELDFLAGNVPGQKYRFDVVSYGGIQEVLMTLSSTSDYTPAWGKEINLIEASAAAQSQLTSAGFKIKGIFNNPDRMAFVDFTELAAHLPAGHYTLSLKAKDSLGRVSAPVSVSLNIVATKLDVDAESGVAIFGANSGTLQLSYNGSAPEKSITFEAQNRHGVFEKCEATFDLLSRTRAFDALQYSVNLQLPDIGSRSVVPVKIYLFGEEQMPIVNLKVLTPEFEVVTDALAKSVLFKVTTAESKMIPAIVNNLVLYNNGQPVDNNAMTRNADTGVIKLTGLTSGTSYAGFSVGLGDAENAKAIPSFTTEQETDVTNGNFDSTEETINIKDIKDGGNYKTGVKSECYNYTDIVVSVPSRSTGWATLNPLTCYTGSTVQNTWCMVPSTYMENGAAKIRSVAYSHNGPEPPLINYGTWVYRYYSQNAPESFGARTSGELFLGSYDYTGTPNRTDGIAFTTRPSSVTFDYSYVPYEGETGEVYIAVLNSQNQVISTATKEIGAASNAKMTVSLPEYAFGAKAAKLQIRFRSSSGSVSTKVPTGTDLDDTSSHTNGTNAAAPASGGYHIRANEYKALSTGSELTIDNVKLNY